MPSHDLPINLNTDLFSKSNAWFVVGLPDTEEQFIESRKRGGIGSQTNAADYFETVKFVETEFPEGHDLHEARYVPPIVEPTGNKIIPADLYQSYFLKRRRFQRLSDFGLNVVLGARKEDLIFAANLAFANNGLLSLLTHFEDSRRLEFTDGFLNIGDIPKFRRQGGRGLLHLCVCKGAEKLREIKFSFSSNIWACAPYRKLGATASFEYILALGSSIVIAPHPFLVHHENAQVTMRNAGLMESKPLLTT